MPVIDKWHNNHQLIPLVQIEFYSGLADNSYDAYDAWTKKRQLELFTQRFQWYLLTIFANEIIASPITKAGTSH